MIKHLLLIPAFVLTIGSSNIEAYQGSSLSTSGTYMTKSGAFIVASDDTLWEQSTDIDIFSGLDVIAPGDNGVFVLTIVNGKDGAMDYTMGFEKFQDETLPIPLMFRMRTAEGNYIDDDEWIFAEELGQIASTISANDNYSYILEWKWDGNADDTYDTLLGTSEQLEYTMSITVTASESSMDMNTPQTGDDTSIVAIIIALCASTLSIILLVIKKKDKDEKYI